MKNINDNQYHKMFNGQEIHDSFLNILILLSKRSQGLLNDMRHSNIYTGIVHVSEYNKMNQNQKRVFQRQIRELKKYKIIRKIVSFKSPKNNIASNEEIIHVPKHTYMIDPFLIKPIDNEIARAIWNQLEEKQNKEI